MAGGLSRWEAGGPHLVVGIETGEWAQVGGEKLAVFAQLPVTDRSAALPVVVLSHGLGGSHLGYAGLGAHFASHGFAVLHPQFLDSVFRLQVSASLAGAGPAGEEAVRAAMRPLLFDPAHWASRVARVRCVLDSLADQQHLPVRLAPAGITLVGHSYGAFVTQLLLGVELSGPGEDIDTSPHPGVACAILLSPQGSGDRGLTESSWDAVTTPMLEITATHDLGPHGEGLTWRREPFDRARSRRRHLAVVRGGDHFLGGIPRTEAEDLAAGGEDHPDRRVRRAVTAVAVAFAEWVRGDEAAGDWLRSAPVGSVLDHCHIEAPR